jgi:expansin (peptidoglycan-binding protein)
MLKSLICFSLLICVFSLNKILMTNNSKSKSIPSVGKNINGHLTYYNDAGYGACGSKINAASEDLVAVSHVWFTTQNPNNDPVCNLCVKVDYQGKSIKVRVKDKCPSCNSDHIDLSKTSFSKLANLSIGNVQAKWSFVTC